MAVPDSCPVRKDCGRCPGSDQEGMPYKKRKAFLAVQIPHHEAGQNDRGSGSVDPGYFLMVSHLDELPQFFNILKGDMSVVGPYPEQVESAEHIQKKLPEFTYRQAVKAGLTGYAKVHGKYSSSKSNQLKMDFYYIQNYSFALDLSIIASTLKVLLEPSVSRRK